MRVISCSKSAGIRDISRILYQAIIFLRDQYPEFKRYEQQHHSLFGLAPEGACRAARITPMPGGLLHRRFTLTGIAPGGMLSVALSFPQTFSAVSSVRRTSCSVESGLSSPFPARPPSRIPAPFNLDEIWKKSRARRKNVRPSAFVPLGHTGGTEAGDFLFAEVEDLFSGRGEPRIPVRHAGSGFERDIPVFFRKFR